MKSAATSAILVLTVLSRLPVGGVGVEHVETARRRQLDAFVPQAALRALSHVDALLKMIEASPGG